MLNIERLNHSFNNTPIFIDYSLAIAAPKVCLVAANGQGKTTLFSIIAGLIKVQSGSIMLNGLLLNNTNQHVALASDKIIFPDFLTAKQVIELVCACWHCPWPTDIIEGLSFGIQLDTKVADLSSGSLKKLQLITALARQAQLTLLDEPSAALDHDSLTFLLQLLTARSGQIIITSHEPDPFTQIGFELKALNNV